MLSRIRFQLDPDSVWSNIKSIGVVESVRQVDGKTTVETRYFISDVEDNAKKSANSVRSHWGIENSLYWVGIRCSVKRR